LLVAPSWLNGQERLTLNKLPTNEQIQSAKDIVKSAETAPTKLSTGGYALIDIKLEGKLKSYVVPGSDDCIKTILIAKGQAYEGWLVDKDSNQFGWKRIDPVAWDRVLVTGIKNGTATLIWHMVQNGESEVVAAFQFIIGKPPLNPDEPPDVPVDDELTKGMRAALAKDKAAGVADVKYLLSLSGIYEAASKDSLDTIKTAGELDALLNAARLAANIPEPEKMLPEVRQFIKRQMQANLGTEQSTPINADAKRLAKTLMGKIGDSLEKLAK